MTIFTKDQALYRRMSEPHPSQEAANTELTAFWDDLRVIRERHRVRDVVCAVSMAYKVDGGVDAETTAQAQLVIGSSAEAVGMAAMLYGGLRADWQAAMDMASDAPRRKT